MCTDDYKCSLSYQPCIMAEWETWGECSCYWDSCRKTRLRRVLLYPSCGGALCDESFEVAVCFPSPGTL